MEGKFRKQTTNNQSDCFINWEASSAVAEKKKIQCLSARLIVAAGGANLIRIVAFLCEVSEKEGNVHNQRPEW